MRLLAALGLLMLAPSPGRAQPAASAITPTWTDIADLVLASPIVLVVDIGDVDRLSRRDAPDVPPGQVRALVQGSLRNALKAPSVLPAGAAWLWQGTADRRGRPPFAKPQPVILFAAPLSGGSNPEVQPLRLVSPHGQQPWSAAAEAQVRRILAEAVKPGADGTMVTAVIDGFRTAGSVDGASESQFFLQTKGNRPMTLLVRRAPDADPQLRVATDEFVDRAAPVARETLTWRGLACGLPPELPPALRADTALAEDYGFARRAIGACGRALPPPQ
jgi:hypothetical protein